MCILMAWLVLQVFKQIGQEIRGRVTCLASKCLTKCIFAAACKPHRLQVHLPKSSLTMFEFEKCSNSSTDKAVLWLPRIQWMISGWKSASCVCTFNDAVPREMCSGDFSNFSLSCTICYKYGKWRAEAWHAWTLYVCLCLFCSLRIYHKLSISTHSLQTYPSAPSTCWPGGSPQTPHGTFQFGPL